MNCSDNKLPYSEKNDCKLSSCVEVLRCEFSDEPSKFPSVEMSYLKYLTKSYYQLLKGVIL